MSHPANPGDADQPQQPPVPSLNVQTIIPLQYPSTFWRSLDVPLIKCEVELFFIMDAGCALIEHQNNITDVDFKITNAKLYESVVILSISDKIKFLENLKQGFRRLISWNKYKSEITTQPNINNLD